MVVQDLYVPRELRGSAAQVPDVPGIEQLARAGTRKQLRQGWREPLLRRAGRSDLEGAAPACIAVAGLEPAHAADRVAAPQGRPPGARWIATALHLRAGLRGVHLDQGGVLRIPPGEQAQLSADFRRTFGSSAGALVPLPSGEFLLDTPGIAALATPEPARCAGSELAAAMPTGPAAAPLRRLLAEIEMWLHAQPVNESRRERGALPISALWPWGASGRVVSAAPGACGAAVELPLACGRDAWLEGLWRLQGAAVRALPQSLEALLAESAAEGLLLVELGGELRGEGDSVSNVLCRIDERLVSPALAALRRAALDRLSLVLNDVCIQLQRANLRRFWRRGRPGLTGFL
jgi:hypothetical protein